jgi:glutathionylspermidine synthase
VVLWELFPDHPNLLRATFDPMNDSFVRKPVLSREGANILIQTGGQTVIETPGKYEGPYVYQQYQPLPVFAGNRPVIGSWMVNGYASGIGIREDQSLVTGNLSRFVPHLFS